MTRVLADLPPEDIAWLDARAAEAGRSRAAVLREAVSAYRAGAVAHDGFGWLDAALGAWPHMAGQDAVAWQQRERGSWSHRYDGDGEDGTFGYVDLAKVAGVPERAIQPNRTIGNHTVVPHSQP